MKNIFSLKISNISTVIRKKYNRIMELISTADELVVEIEQLNEYVIKAEIL